MPEIDRSTPNVHPLKDASPGRDGVYGSEAARDMHNRNYAGDDFSPAAVVKLKTGPAITPDSISIELGPLRCGMPVEVVLENINDQVTLAEFRPRTSS